jgi:hypothetical protein
MNLDGGGLRHVRGRSARAALGRLRRSRRPRRVGLPDDLLRETGLAHNGLTGLTYKQALGVANPSASTAGPPSA